MTTQQTNPIAAAERIALDSTDSFPSRIGRVFLIEAAEIAVFRTSDDEFYAVENLNPHPKGGPLAEAIVSGHYIYDPLYDWKIDLKTGLVQEPDTGEVRTFRVEVADNQVILFTK
ncbi:nitrite reductase small subunit NirD [Saccharibacillus sp. CPCC 101409]|uniref:nitrite reductase small subunit NirD n=1 Tax=Saccharibacillus sp. CPCC 101409 TaxID=3058041 RepID=UPI0026735AC0|nr:nitrite reductase small subunit NirD [Saccharibacillus sp. CPCC 101409]MDO3408920.1 nitrite reductase small subunit NirD [Saccharibacillus sp. CPCC 101409]